MNLVKFADKWFDYTKEASAYNTYNKYFANKYAVAPRYKYVFVIDNLTLADYILIEQYGIKDFASSKLEYELDEDGNFVLEDDSVEYKIKEVPYVDVTVNDPDGTVIKNCIVIAYSTVADFVDSTKTIKINSTSKYAAENEYISDVDITIEELMNFRTWLAEKLLEIDEADDEDIEFEDDVKYMLNYYKSSMTDETITILTEMSKYVGTVNMTSSTTTSCGCTTNANQQLLKLFGNSSLGQSMQTLDLSNLTISTCDPIAMYRRYMYNCMVKTFQDYTFWENMPKPFILEFAKYIRGIIDNNFPLYEDEFLTTFADCSCLNDSSASQTSLQAVLEKLYKSLMYIYNDETSGNKNYMNDAFQQWAAKLYEKMEWYDISK